MDLNEYQAQAGKTTPKDMSDIEMLTNAVLGLAGETGELIEHVKKHVYQGHDLSKTEIATELGDVLWYVAYVASSVGLSLDSVAEKNIEKLRKRYGEAFDASKSIHRGE